VNQEKTTHHPQNRRSVCNFPLCRDRGWSRRMLSNWCRGSNRRESHSAALGSGLRRRNFAAAGATLRNCFRSVPGYLSVSGIMARISGRRPVQTLHGRVLYVPSLCRLPEAGDAYFCGALIYPVGLRLHAPVLFARHISLDEVWFVSHRTSHSLWTGEWSL
jgi:hypothetical protein